MSVTDCSDCRRLGEDLKALRDQLSVVRSELRQQERRTRDEEQRRIDAERELERVSGKSAVIDALGEVVCGGCGLACRDSGSGCSQCWDRRQVYEEARR